MAKSYEDLLGSRSGRFVPKHHAGSLRLSPASSTLKVAGVEFPLVEVGLNRFTAAANQARQEWSQGTELDCEVVVHGEQVFRGLARIAAIEQHGAQSRIGLQVKHGYVDIHAARRAQDEVRLRGELSEHPLDRTASLPSDFKHATTDVALFISHYKKMLSRYEEEIDRNDTNSSLRLAELAEQSVQLIRDRWTDVRRRACRASIDVLQNEELRRAGKFLTETLVTSLLLESPVVARAYQKPLGYPGDYKMMLYCYENRPRGKTAHGLVFHKLFVEHPLSRGIATRNEFVVRHAIDEHENACRQSGTHTSFRLMSLGCGPAHDVQAFVRERGSWPGELTWLLVDQEHEALELAHSNCVEAFARADGFGKLEIRHLGFMRLLRRPELLGPVALQNFICCSGLFDYLQADKARSVISWLYGLLAPGGLLMVGNAAGPNEHFWSTEFVLDWSLIYRSVDQMRDLASDLPPDATTQVAAEPNGAYHYLCIRKPSTVAIEP